MRIDKYIAVALGLTRNDARKMIKNGFVKVNDKVVTRNDLFVKEIEDIVYYNNEPLVYKQFVYIMMNKPKGYISANKDNHNKVVLDLIKGYEGYDLSIIGRLDIDTEGLLIFTNNGSILHKLTNPKNNHYKKYYLEIDGVFYKEDIEKVKEGVDIIETEGVIYHTLPAILEIIDDTKAYIKIVEGKYHQIKKMCLSLGKRVTYLKRVEINGLKLDEKLKKGEYRELSEEEIDLLKS